MSSKSSMIEKKNNKSTTGNCLIAIVEIPWFEENKKSQSTLSKCTETLPKSFLGEQFQIVNSMENIKIWNTIINKR